MKSRVGESTTGLSSLNFNKINSFYIAKEYKKKRKLVKSLENEKELKIRHNNETLHIINRSFEIIDKKKKVKAPV